MGHVVLLGDSIFDNARYVPDRLPVIEQTRLALPSGWKATLRAVDGATIDDVSMQTSKIPDEVTHYVLSVGGNDALMESSALREPACTVGEAMGQLAAVRERFRINYRGMLLDLRILGKPVIVCTIYDAIPNLPVAERTALGLFNEVILREAVAARVPVIDLRLICTEPGDYSPLSSIEPSVVGGAKIAERIALAVTTHDFTTKRTAIYT